MAKKNIKSKSVNKVSETALEKTSNFNWLFILVVLVLTFLVFKPCLKYGFVNWDDYESLINNPKLTSFGNEWSWPAVKTIFTTEVLGAYIPLSSLSFALEKHFFAPHPLEQPFVFHFTNLLIHLVSTYLVFLLFSQLLKRQWTALFAALLFGIHPMRVESVVWVTERKDVLYGMFFLLSLLFYIKYFQAERKKPLWFVLALLFSICSYFSKVQAVTLPLTMVVIDLFFSRKWLSVKLLILEKLPWWLLSLLFGLINIYFLTQTKAVRLEGSELSYSITEKIALAIYSYFEYLIKFLYPYKMSPIYSFPEEVPVLAYLYILILLVFLTLLGIWSYRNKTYWLVYGLTFFTVNIIFMLQIVVAGQTYQADRYTYIAYIGLIIPVAKGMEILQDKYKSYQYILYTFLFLYTGVLMYMTNRQVKIWANTKKLWEHTLSLFPDEKIALRNLGQYYLDEEKDYSKGIKILQYAIGNYPKEPAIYNNLGKAYTDEASGIIQNTEENTAKYKELMNQALQTLNKANEVDSLAGRKRPELSSKILVNRAVAKSGLNKFVEAIEDINHGLIYDSLNKSGHSNRALIYLYLNQYEMAVKSFDSALELEPNNADMYFQRGMSKLELKRYNDALTDIGKAFSLNADQPVYYLGRAQVYKAMGDEANFLKDVSEAKARGVEIPKDMQK